MSRPGVKARTWAWKAKDKTETPGIALWGRKGLTAHLTYNEARTLADSIHDLCDAAGTPATSTEQEPTE
jgi:hypothetical protein